MNPRSIKGKLFNEEISIRQRIFVLNVFVTLVILGVIFVEVAITDHVYLDVALLAALMVFILASIMMDVRMKTGIKIFLLNVKQIEMKSIIELYKL